MRTKTKNFKSGFTLIELMVAITIIAIMASVAIFGLPSVQQKGQDTQKFASFRELQLALEGYKGINGKYPNAGVAGTNDYIINLTPGFMNSLPTGGFNYVVSSDNKTYCLYVIGTIYKPSSQPELEVDCEKSWGYCKGPEAETLNNCSALMGGGSGDGLDSY